MNVNDDELKNHFGSWMKSDYEILIFNEWLKTIFKDKTDYQISLDLRIPVQKVKKLRNNAILRYGNIKEADLKKSFLDLAQHATLENGKIRIFVKNSNLKACLNDELERTNHYGDTSFNRDIMVLSPKAFADLLVWADSTKVDEIVAKAKKNAKDEQNLSLSDIIEGLILDSAGNFLGGGAVEVIKTIIPCLIK